MRRNAVVVKDTAPLEAPNHMAASAESLKDRILKVIADGWVLKNFKYDSVSCDSENKEAGPGISFQLSYPKKGVDCALNYPLKEYPTHQDILDSLNCDAVFIYLAVNYPELCIIAINLSKNTLRLDHPKAGEITLTCLDQCYDKSRGVFSIEKYIKLANQAISKSNNTSPQFRSRGDNLFSVPKITIPHNKTIEVSPVAFFLENNDSNSNVPQPP